MKSVIVCLALVTFCLSLMVIPFSTWAESMEKISAPDLSMIQGKWEGKWEYSAGKRKKGSSGSDQGEAEMTIEGERAASIYINRPFVPSVQRKVTILGSEIILANQAGSINDTLKLYKKPNGTKVLKGTFRVITHIGETRDGEVYLEQVSDAAPKAQ